MGTTSAPEYVNAVWELEQDANRRARAMSGRRKQKQGDPAVSYHRGVCQDASTFTKKRMRMNVLYEQY
jgi:hypothetical protein